MKYFDIKWLSTTLFIFCGTLVALKLPYMQYAFPGFVIAHGVLAHHFYKVHPNKPLLIQNIYFFFLNTAASYVWLFKG
jgi:hypothetical protein